MFGFKPKNPLPKEGKMELRQRGDGIKVSLAQDFRSSTRLLWVSAEQDGEGRPLKTRAPQESTRVCPCPGPFEAAGRSYNSLDELTRKQLDDNWSLDRYGRRVLCIVERFPCFDSYDAMHEHRFNRWFFLRVGDSLTRVFYKDEQNEVYITEDVENLENDCWREFCKHGFYGAQDLRV